jgi:hypothetical protein
MGCPAYCTQLCLLLLQGLGHPCPLGLFSHVQKTVYPAAPAPLYLSHSASRRSLGDSHTCICRCSGSRCRRCDKGRRHMSLASLEAEGTPTESGVMACASHPNSATSQSLGLHADAPEKQMHGGQRPQSGLALPHSIQAGSSWHGSSLGLASHPPSTLGPHQSRSASQ